MGVSLRHYEKSTFGGWRQMSDRRGVWLSQDEFKKMCHKAKHVLAEMAKLEEAIRAAAAAKNTANNNNSAGLGAPPFGPFKRQPVTVL